MNNPKCKIGQVVYQTDFVRIYESTIQDILNVNGKTIYSLGENNIDLDDTAIGHSIFITKEELIKKYPLVFSGK